MTWWQAIILGALQGVTEFLPISSSGHLVLAQHFLGFGHPQDKGAALFFDGLVHLGTLVAVLLYFRRELRTFFRPDPSSAAGADRLKWYSAFRLGFLVLIASLPAAVAVLVAGEHIEASFEKPRPVAIHLLLLGLVLLVVNQLRYGRDSFERMRWWQAIVIGTGQAAAALMRGLSRSGMTISAALVAGVERQWAVRFSFILSIFANLGLAGLGLVRAFSDGNSPPWLTADFLLWSVVGSVVSGVVGYASIGPLVRLVTRFRLWWFSIYLWLIGCLMLVLLP